MTQMFAAPTPWRWAPPSPEPVGLEVERLSALARACGAPEGCAQDWAAQAEAGALAARHGDEGEDGDD